MKVKYDWETRITEYKCESCGYVYKVDETKIYKYEREIIGDEEFIQLAQTDIIKNPNEYNERIEKTTLYACPKCGCVHIAV